MAYGHTSVAWHDLWVCALWHRFWVVSLKLPMQTPGFGIIYCIYCVNSYLCYVSFNDMVHVYILPSKLVSSTLCMCVCAYVLYCIVIHEMSLSPYSFYSMYTFKHQIIDYKGWPRTSSKSSNALHRTGIMWITSLHHFFQMCMGRKALMF